MKRVLLAIVWLVVAYSQAGDYNHATTTNIVNQTWMTPLGDGIPLRKLSLLGTENSFNSPSWDLLYMGQTLSFSAQLTAGIRLFDIHVRHYKDQFPLHHGVVYLQDYLQDVLATMRAWLAVYPGEALVVRIEQDQTIFSWGNTRSLQATMAAYVANNSDIIWSPTSQNPTLGEVRGKVVILQAFPATGTYGLLESSFFVEPDTYFATNWDLYSKWLKVKQALNTANLGGGSIISFWTGYGFSYRFFVASGKLGSSNSSPRLWTGLTTPMFKSKYPDFPRVSIVWGISNIMFEGINILGSSYIAANNLTSVGWVFTNFPGDQLVKRATAVNYLKYGICTSAHIAAGCTSCSPVPVCLTCNTLIGYLYDAVNKACIASPGYYVAGAPPVLCNSSIFGCSLCSSGTVCTQCNTTANYALDSVTNQCIAAAGYYLNATNIPIACNTSLRGCAVCNSATVCTQCYTALSYILEGATSTCICDATAFMVDAVTQPVCICKSGYYISGGVCVPMPDCSLPASGCLACTSPACSSCDATLFFTLDTSINVCVCTDGYYFDGSVCQLCSTTLIGCTSCTTPTICLACTPTFVLSLPNCGCTAGFYLDTTVPNCATCQVGCLICTDLPTCVTCDIPNNFIQLANTSCTCNVGYFLNNTLSVCQTCSSMAGCLACNTTGCTDCDATLNFTLNPTTFLCDCAVGYYIGTNDLCTLCSLTGCLDCASKTVCRVCDTAMFFINATTQVCDEICGDGLLFFLQCDDGNNIDGDGCSSTCVIEQDYACVGGDSTFRSVCSYNKPIAMTLVQSLKKVMLNQISLKFTLQPALKDLNSVDFSSVVTTNITGVQSIIFTYDGNGSLSADITYNTSLEATPVSVTFTPPYSAAFYSTPITTVDFNIDSSNNQGVYYFPPEVYQLQATLDTITTVLGYVLLGATLLALPFGRVIPIEMSGIFQVTFLGILTIENLQPLMIPFRKLYPVNGINTLFGSPDSSSSLPSRISAMGLNSSYFVNLNYAVIIILLPLLAALILFVVNRIAKDKDAWIKRVYQACCEWFLACLLLLEYYNIACLLIQFLYSPTTEDMYYAGAAVGALIFCCSVTMIGVYSAQKGNMGEFISLFKLAPFAQKYQIYQFVARMLLIALMVGMNSLVALSYIMVLFPLASIIILAIFKPYAHNYNTYRAIFNECSLLLILGLYSYYRLEIATNNYVNMFSLYLPLGVIGLLLLVLATNVFFVIKTFKQTLNNSDSYQRKRKESETSLAMEMMRHLRVKLSTDATYGDKRGVTRHRPTPKPQDLDMTAQSLRHKLLELDPQAVTPTGEIKIRIDKLATGQKLPVKKFEEHQMTPEEEQQVEAEFDMI